VAGGGRLRDRPERAAHPWEGDELPERPHHSPKALDQSTDGGFAARRDPWMRDGSAGKLACRGGECKVGMAYEVERSR